MHRIAVWDLPTRLFHWLLVIAFALAWLDAEDNRFLAVHVYSGYLMLALVLFRFVWGFAGTRHARFSDFAYSWREVLAHLLEIIKRRPRHYTGHTPAGSWAVFAMLLLAVAIGITGLIALGGEERHGPLAGMLTFHQGTRFREIHEILAEIMLGVVVLHIAGVITETLLLRENLARSMVTGYKTESSIELSVPMHTLLGGVMLALTLGGAFYYFKGYLFETPENPYRPFVSPPLPMDTSWKESCSECHLAFHPTLLPARSWEKLLTDQSNHFGDDLALDGAAITTLRDFALKYSAESELNEPAWKINSTTPAGETPLRITDTWYWKHKHEDIASALFESATVRKKSNCPACHLDAEAGTFEDSAMRLPKQEGAPPPR